MTEFKIKCKPIKQSEELTISFVSSFADISKAEVERDAELIVYALRNKISVDLYEEVFKLMNLCQDDSNVGRQIRDKVEAKIKQGFK